MAAAKAELIEELQGGTAVVPADEPLLDRHVHRYRGRVVTFGDETADVALIDEERRGESTHVLVDAFGHRGTLDFSFTGGHYLHDALAALAAFVELGYRLDQAKAGAAQVAFSDLRGAVSDLPGGGLLLNDAYNANPVAMKAAVDHLVTIAGDRPRVAILGDMYELGPGAEAYHRAVGEHCAAAGVRLVAVGDLAARLPHRRAGRTLVRHRRRVPRGAAGARPAGQRRPGQGLAPAAPGARRRGAAGPAREDVDA